MIAKITKAYVRRYSDSGQVTAYVEWLDHKGASGRTEAPAKRIGDKHYYVGQRMGSLLYRAERQGVPITRETW